MPIVGFRIENCPSSKSGNPAPLSEAEEQLLINRENEAIQTLHRIFSGVTITFLGMIGELRAYTGSNWHLDVSRTQLQDASRVVDALQKLLFAYGYTVSHVGQPELYTFLASPQEKFNPQHATI